MKTILTTLLIAINTALGGVAVLNGLAHELNVTPGNTYKGKIELQNASDIAQVVTIYQSDLSTKYTGETFYTDSITNDRSNISWINLSSLSITLESEEKGSIDFQITVPNSGTLTGTYWSVIMVEPRDPIHVQEDQSGYSIQSKYLLVE